MEFVNTQQNYIPEDRTVGEIIETKLLELGMKQAELAETTGITKSVICDIIKGNRSVTAEMAVLIECAIQIPAFYLLQVQAKHDIDEATNIQRVQNMMLSIYDWKTIKDVLPLASLKMLGKIKGNVQDNVQAVFDMFHVKSSEELIAMKASEQEAFLRRSYKVYFDDDTLFTWKHYCFDEACKTKVNKSFRHESIDSLSNELIEIFFENKNTFDRIEKAFFNAGIRLLYINKVGQLPVDGMSFWRDENPTVILTRRMKSIDSFAFSAMHELGHIKCHLKKGNQTLINFDTTDRDNIEAEADAFALDAFISKEEWSEFMDSVKGTNPFAVHPKIKALADRNRINPQILFGRYMHDTNQYRLKRVFETEIR